MISFPLRLLINLKARHSQHYYHLYKLLFILTNEPSSVELMETLAKGFLYSASPKKCQYSTTSQRKGLPSFHSPSKQRSFSHSLCLQVFSSQCLIYFDSISSRTSADYMQFRYPVIPHSRRHQSDKNTPRSLYGPKNSSPVV